MRFDSVSPPLSEMAQRAAERHAKWLRDFEARIARHERISAEDVENYGRIPPNYVREPDWLDWFIWRPAS